MSCWRAARCAASTSPFELGAANVEVTVRADAAVIATETSKIQEQFEKQRFEEMPLIGDGRTPDAVLISLPMVQNAGGVYSVQMAGQPTKQIQGGQDGHTNDGSTNQINNYHDIQEVVAVAVNNSAEFARVGYYDMTTKSGGNKLHVDLSYWHQNSSLGARDFFATTKPVAKAHTMVGAVSGPIRKDKTFFYASYNSQRWPGGIFYTRNVPTNLMRTGDFSELLTQAKPVIVKDPLNGAPFPGNVIPADRINPVSLKVQNGYLPAPDQGGPHDQARNFGYLFPYPGDVRWWDLVTGRIDHKISEKNTIHGRLSMNWGRYIRYIDYPALIRTRTRPNSHLTDRGHARVFSGAGQHRALRPLQGDSQRRRPGQRRHSGEGRPGHQGSRNSRRESAESQRHGIPHHGDLRLFEYRHTGGRHYERRS